MWAPVLLAICFYLAASVVFPHDEADHERLADYYSERKRFVVALLLAGEMLIHVTYLQVFKERLAHRPAVFWLWTVPYNVAIETAMIALLFVRSRRANIVLLIALNLLLTIPVLGPERDPERGRAELGILSAESGTQKPFPTAPLLWLKLADARPRRIQRNRQSLS